MYNNIIVTESYANIRAMARKALSGKWMIFLSVCLYSCFLVH